MKILIEVTDNSYLDKINQAKKEMDSRIPVDFIVEDKVILVKVGRNDDDTKTYVVSKNKLKNVIASLY